MPDAWETAHGLNPNVADSQADADGDGLRNELEYQHGCDPQKMDSDDDGLTDGDEVLLYGTNPLNADSDGDGMPDGWEVANGLDPWKNDAVGDLDFDWLTNLQEYQAGLNPRKIDSKGDGIDDYSRVKGTVEVKYQYDGMNRLISAEYSNGLVIACVYDGNSRISRRVTMSPDNDGDGLNDLWEMRNGLSFRDATGSQGNSGDSDGDGWTNYQEQLAGTDPANAASFPSAGTAGLIESPPVARIESHFAIPNIGVALVVRLWDAENTKVVPELQWYDPAAAQWEPGGLAHWDGSAIGSSSGLTISPGPVANRAVIIWNGGIITDAGRLRIRASDVGATGDWSPDYTFTVASTALLPQDDDGDQLSNADEYFHGTDPFNRDTDGDFVRDGQEVLDGTSPTDPGSYLVHAVSGDNLQAASSFGGSVSNSAFDGQICGGQGCPVGITENATITNYSGFLTPCLLGDPEVTIRITFGAGAGGQLTVDGATVLTGSTKLAIKGQQLDLIAQPDQGWEFAGWNGLVAGTTNPLRARVVDSGLLGYEFRLSGATTLYTRAVLAATDGITDASLVGPNADFDHDGLPNLLEYALLGDLRHAGKDRLVEASTERKPGGTELVLRFSVRTDDPGISFSCETSESLLGWLHADLNHTDVGWVTSQPWAKIRNAVSHPDGTWTLEVGIFAPGGNRVFGRVGVEAR